MMTARNVVLLALLAIRVSVTTCSWGDIDPNYQGCVQSCTITECQDSTVYNYPRSALRKHSPYTIPGYQVVPLSCEELCNYGCIDEISSRRLSADAGVVKYYGHWPFTRYFGLEEPASVAFSLLNAVPHMMYFVRSVSASSSSSAPCYITPWLRGYSIMACICWLSSAIYHSKKTFHTPQLDLITALGFIAFGLFMALRRIAGHKIRGWHVGVSFTTMFLCWAYRAYYMMQGLVRFDSHMMVSIVIVILTTTLWLLWILHAQFISSTREGILVKYLCLLCQVWLICASALEIFDFPPYFGIFDAHSLWHAATVPLGFLWYHFWEQDRPYRCKSVIETKKSK